MIVAMTYDLRQDYLARGYSLEETAEFDSPATVDAIAFALQDMDCNVVRIGCVQELVNRLARGERWDLVFNIAEGMHGAGRESQVPALLDAYEIPYTFSGPAVLSLCLDKAAAKAVVRAAGVPTPDWTVLRQTDDTAAVSMEYPLFCKPTAEGTGKGVSPRSLVRSQEDLRRTAEALLSAHGQPVLAESYLPGREFTVGMAGHGNSARVLGVLEICFSDNADQAGYTYDNKQHYHDRVTYSLVHDAEALEAGSVALQAWRVLGCLDAGRVDLRSDVSGQPQFMEVNPLAGLHPVDSDLPILCRLSGVAYDGLIKEIVHSALERAEMAGQSRGLGLAAA